MTSGDALMEPRRDHVDGAPETLAAAEQQDSDWYAVRGTALLAAGNPVGARLALMQAIALHDTSPTVMLNLALSRK